MPRKILYDRCMSCGGCVGVCPSLALTLEKGSELKIDEDKCTDCGICTRFCPAGAIVEAAA